jgi:hypothetical protein
LAIENHKEWLEEYEALCVDLRKWVVNNWIGVWVRELLGGTAIQQVASRRTSLAGSYSKLSFGPPAGSVHPSKTVRVKRKESEALQLMSSYYYAHKSELPADISRFRQPIVDLLMQGVSAEDAYEALRRRPT